MREWERRVQQAQSEMAEYKRKLYDSQRQIKELKETIDGVEGAGGGANETTICTPGSSKRRKSKSRGVREPRDIEGTEKNCIIFGWTAW